MQCVYITRAQIKHVRFILEVLICLALALSFSPILKDVKACLLCFVRKMKDSFLSCILEKLLRVVVETF